MLPPSNEEQSAGNCLATPREPGYATVLSVAVPAAASVVQTIPTGLFPREITVGSDDRTLYLTSYDSGSFQVISTTVQ